jgi:hypothetical protein
MMTTRQINDLRDLWEGCFDFETALAMIDADDHAKEALKHWSAWNRKLEASQRAW